MIQKIWIEKVQYKVLDALECVNLADSFVKNKIGHGHGEAKLYIGNENNKLFDFFQEFNEQCFFYKKDFRIYLADAENEFKHPHQKYIKKDMFTKFKEVKKNLSKFDDEILFFKIYRVGVAPPRVYINSSSSYYNFMREIALPNLSYLSILKLQRDDEEIFYYFRIFFDHKIIGETYLTSEEQVIEKEIIASDISSTQKQILINARIGQGKYRSKLLLECPSCPFTGVDDERLLVASHIKPWAKSTNEEKIDSKNGFIFTPTYDQLFDRGFITFDEDKTLFVSPWISQSNQKKLGIYNGKKMLLLPLCDKRKKYLEYHREFIFKS